MGGRETDSQGAAFLLLGSGLNFAIATWPVGSTLVLGRFGFLCAAPPGPGLGEPDRHCDAHIHSRSSFHRSVHSVTLPGGFLGLSLCTGLCLAHKQDRLAES